MTWKAYAEQRLHISERHLYRMIDHNRFMNALGDAAGADLKVSLPEFATAEDKAYTRGLKPVIPKIISKIEERMKNVTPHTTRFKRLPR